MASEANSTDWTPDFPSLVFGVLIGFFVAFIGLKVAEHKADQAVFMKASIIVEEVVEKPLEFDFYEALKSYFGGSIRHFSGQPSRPILDIGMVVS